MLGALIFFALATLFALVCIHFHEVREARRSGFYAGYEAARGRGETGARTGERRLTMRQRLHGRR